MELLVSVGSLVLSLFLTVLSVKLAAGWMDAEHNGWGRCVVALLLAYVVFAVVGVVASIGAGMLPEPINLVVLVVALVLAIVAPIMVFARILGTSGLRAFGIVVIALIVNIAIAAGLVFAVVTVLGIGIAGLAAMFGIAGMGGMGDGGGMGGTADPEALNRFDQDVQQLCACADQGCVDRVSTEMLDNLMAAMQTSMNSGNPADQARLEALSQRMEQCQNTADSEPMPMPEPAPEPMPEPMPAPEPMPSPEPMPQASESMPEMAPQAVTAPAAMPSTSRGSYAYRDVSGAEAAAQIGKLVRLTLVDGSQPRDQLVGVETGALVLKRAKSQGGGTYTVPTANVLRMEVFDR